MTGVNKKSERFDRFVEALDALCKEHDVHLSTSGYDLFSVLGPGFEAGVDIQRIEDKTDWCL